MTVTGSIAFRDLETGVWVLEADDGQTYRLAGGDRKLKKDGHRVEVHGEVEAQGVDLAMVGPTFNVHRYRFL